MGKKGIAVFRVAAIGFAATGAPELDIGSDTDEIAGIAISTAAGEAVGVPISPFEAMKRELAFVSGVSFWAVLFEGAMGLLAVVGLSG